MAGDYSTCEGFFSVQLSELVRMNQLHSNVEELYHTKIGTLYDEFNTEIPLRFEKDYDYLWSEGTIETVKEAAETAAKILNEVRVEPKPYQPLSSEDVRKQVKVIEKAIMSNMTDKLLECACPFYYKDAK